MKARVVFIMGMLLALVGHGAYAQQIGDVYKRQLLFTSKDFIEKVLSPGHGVLADLFSLLGYHEEEAVQGLVGHVLIRIKGEGPCKGYGTGRLLRSEGPLSNRSRCPCSTPWNRGRLPSAAP